jgi:hypothetical protein
MEHHSFQPYLSHPQKLPLPPRLLIQTLILLTLNLIPTIVEVENEPKVNKGVKARAGSKEVSPVEEA